MATKISELTNLTTVAGADLVVVVDEVANSSAIETKKVTVNNFFNGLGVTTGNGISGSVSGNSLTITADTPLLNKVIVTDTRVTSQSNTAPYGNTSSTVTTNAVSTANSSTISFTFGGSITGSVTSIDGVQTVAIDSSESIIQNPEFNTVRVKKLNFNTVATPANSSYVNSTFEVKGGDAFYDTNFIYVAVSNTEIKKIALSAF